MTFCDKSVLSSVAGRIQLHWSILVAASLGCAVAHWAKINFRMQEIMGNNHFMGGGGKHGPDWQ